MDVTLVSEPELARLLEDHTLNVHQRQPIYREAHRREDLRKSRLRIEKMKETMAAKKAAKGEKQ